MPFGHHVDASAHVLYSSVGLEAHVGGETCLCLFGGHPRGQVDEHVRPPPHAVFHQQYAPLALLLQFQGFLQDFGGVSFLVEVQHQALQGHFGILDGTVVVGKPGAMGSPDGQLAFQFPLTGFYASAHLH